MTNPKIAVAGKGTQFSAERQPASGGGRPKGTRDKLSSDFIRELSEDFAKNGKATIVKVRREKPAIYMQVVASLLPKEVQITTPESSLSDEQVEQLYTDMLATRLAKLKTDEPEQRAN